VEGATSVEPTTEAVLATRPFRPRRRSLSMGFPFGRSNLLRLAKRAVGTHGIAVTAMPPRAQCVCQCGLPPRHVPRTWEGRRERRRPRASRHWCPWIHGDGRRDRNCNFPMVVVRAGSASDAWPIGVDVFGVVSLCARGRCGARGRLHRRWPCSNVVLVQRQVYSNASGRRR
jgi:hypothetical protein